MIYLRQANILFLKPFKVAGTSFEIALSKFAGPDDIISPLRRDDEIRRSLGFPGERNYRFTWQERLRMRVNDQLKLLYYKHKQIKYPQHTSARMARDFLGEGSFDKAFKVSIVRDPFDFLISHYFWHNTNADEPVLDFPNWVRQNPRVLNRNEQFYFIDGEEVIDFYIRFENLLEDSLELEKLRPEIRGLSDTLSGISAKSGIRPEHASRENLFRGEPELIEAVKFFQLKHMRKFDYSAPYFSTQD